MIYLELFWTFFKIGAFTFGGGYAMLPLIQAEVESHGWMASADLVNFVAVSESTPGPFAVNISTYVGTELAGIPGGIFATLGVVLPSFLIILLVARCFEAFRNSRIVSGCMAGLKPAVIGLWMSDEKNPPAPTNLKSSGYWGKISRPWFSLPALSLRLGHPRILNESDQLARQHHR